MSRLQLRLPKVICLCCSVFLLLLFSCQEASVEQPDCGLCAETGAEWIQDEKPLPAYDSLFYEDRPAPIFRKEFSVATEIDSAILYITAAGYYKASINGDSIGNRVLDPAWTDYSKRIYYSRYALTDKIRQGENCLGVTLGNGFYNPLPLRKWGRRNPRVDLTVGKPTFMARLVIYYPNGEINEVKTDASWTYGYGPLVKNSVYIGAVYDQGKQMEGWDLPGFKPESWQAAQVGEGPGGELQPAFFPPVRIMEEIQPKAVSTLSNGKHMVDMGVNFTGTYRIRIPPHAGDTITFRFGERVYEDGTLNPMTTVVGQIKREGIGGPGAPPVAWQTDSYISGNKEAFFTPDFVYRTYRYMEIDGLKEQPALADVQGLFIYSDVPDKNNFTSSNALLNDIQDAVKRTFLSNLVSVQSDCAVREKFGYGGDLNATNESFIYNFDMQDFYTKTVYDWVDAMNDSTFVDTAPYAGIKYCGISWESAYLITQYYLYLYYNDTDLVEELYERNLQWMEKVARIHPDGLVESGLSDHESLEPVPVQLTGTAHYLQCARIMKTFAAVMEDGENERHFEALSVSLKNRIKAAFWDQPVEEPINRQTLFSTLLYHDIIPDQELEAARDSLLKAVYNGPSGHFNTGIFGTKYILETLSGHAPINRVFDIVNSTDYPGWGHMIDRGATSIWETWKESDNTFTNSHPMFGTVTEWFYRWLGGIRPDPQNPGFKVFVLAPRVPDELDSIASNYHSPHGEIISNWKKGLDGSITYEIKIPNGSTAKVSLLMRTAQSLSIEKREGDFNPENVKGLATGNFELEEGEYTIRISS
ncbi:alpha-L-rhamnosidase [Cyclobacterium sp.]|uniref:alpha-L-rhamnosidase n=1 Tax=Cyclobacterium sp. TaxID=1966343 RepID=UPI0019C6982B|nr:alpha-L-rhamnosidase [Cyclobacterium sp.]MBD3631067.1 family 78 glycoside hydrolase catalytic domain [Cyclobacterium sp.]